MVPAFVNTVSKKAEALFVIPPSVTEGTARLTEKTVTFEVAIGNGMSNTSLMISSMGAPTR